MALAKFRELVGLSLGAEISSFSTREVLAQRCRNWIDTHPQEWAERLEKMHANSHLRSKPESTDSMTARNHRGTCDAQSLERLKDLATQIGRTPRKSDVPGGLRDLLIKRFGRYHHAVLKAGLKPNTKEYVLDGEHAQ